MSGPPSTVAELVPLADRLRYMRLFRVGAAVFAIAAWLGLPSLDRAGLGTVIAVSAGYLALTLGGDLIWRGLRRRGLALISVLLMLDGVYLAWLLYCTGGPESPLRGLVLVHLIAVCLLGSFRTGLKLALWHSLLALVTFHALEAHVLIGGSPVRFGNADFRVLVAEIVIAWTVAITTAAFAALNERELRRRRHDLEALSRLARVLESATDPLAVADGVVDAVAEDLGYDRILLLASADEGALRALAHRGACELDEPAPPPLPGSALERAASSGRTVLVSGLVDSLDPAVAAMLRDSLNLVVIPLSAEGRVVGFLVVEHGARRRSRIERRVIATLEGFASQSALALHRASLLEQLRQLAARDGLTGVANRRAFEESLRREVARASRTGRPVDLVMLDIDHFKRLNDTHGHQTGDAVLQAVGKTLTELSRASDLVARYGGEEFAIIMPDLEPGLAIEVAERFRIAIAELDGPVPVTASLGVANAPGHAADPDGLVRAADEALYEAKHGGRNRTVAAAEVRLPRPVALR
jgi:diguanylate cyclase (GGDEF)-like protein